MKMPTTNPQTELSYPPLLVSRKSRNMILKPSSIEAVNLRNPENIYYVWNLSKLYEKWEVPGPLDLPVMNVPDGSQHLALVVPLPTPNKTNESCFGIYDYIPNPHSMNTGRSVA